MEVRVVIPKGAAIRAEEGRAARVTQGQARPLMKLGA